MTETITPSYTLFDTISWISAWGACALAFLSIAAAIIFIFSMYFLNAAGVIL